MRLNLFTLSIVSAIFFWFVESTIHYFVFDHGNFEILPHDSNELWMRTLICGLMIVVGLLAERHIRDKEEIHAE